MKKTQIVAVQLTEDELEKIEEIKHELSMRSTSQVLRTSMLEYHKKILK